MDRDVLTRTALDAGFDRAAVISMDEVVFNPEFRASCEENLCGCYNKNYSCPPACGTTEQMKDRAGAYRYGLVLMSRHEIADYKDTQAVTEAKLRHNRAALELMGDMGPSLYMGASCCLLCSPCAMASGEECRFPEQRWSCLSAYCVDVAKLAETSGMELTWEDGIVSLYGIIAFDPLEET